MGFSDLINVTFEDAVLHTVVDNSDIAGFVLPYPWGVSGLNVYNQQEFAAQFPEEFHPQVDSEVKRVYGEIKQYFANGGSRVEISVPVSADMKYHGVQVGSTLMYLVHRLV